MLLGGLTAQMCVVGALMRPASFYKYKSLKALSDVGGGEVGGDDEGGGYDNRAGCERDAKRGGRRGRDNKRGECGDKSGDSSERSPIRDLEFRSKSSKKMEQQKGDEDHVIYIDEDFKFRLFILIHNDSLPKKV